MKNIKELNHLYKIVFHYETGINGWTGKNVTSDEWVYFNGSFENPDKVIKNNNGMYTVDYTGNCIASSPSMKFSWIQLIETLK